MTHSVGPNPSPPVTLQLFGSFQMLVDGRPVPQLRARKDQWLLALLTLAHGRPVQRIWLSQTLWPFPDTLESRATYNLRRSLCTLRRALGEHAHCLLCPSPQTLALDLAHVEADVLNFDAAVTAGNTSALAQAVSLYQGPLLSGCTESWVLPEREARQQQYRQALQTLAAGEIVGGNTAQAVNYLRQAVALDPLWEEAQRDLMQALAARGDHNGALQVYQELVHRLGRQSAAAIPDPQTSMLYQQIRASARRRASTKQPAASGQAVESRRTGHLPIPLTGLIGREEEVRQIGARLQLARLMTLTGSGGVGKTRLAIAVAEAAADEYAEGAWFVELAALSDGMLVAQAVALALGVREQPGRTWTQLLVDALRAKRLLLVLDNCEHLLDACAPFIEALLRECAGLHILTTSRQALGLVGETAWRVPSLPAPDPARLSAEGTERTHVVSAYAAVQLFVERAEAVLTSFALTNENAMDVAQVCSQLDGIPLAIELAAAWVKVLPVEQIRDRLADRLGLLTGGSRAALPHQQTLRATIEWSYNLLSPQEQTLLQRLSVFAGGWTLEAAEAVCTGDAIQGWEVLDLLSSMVDKSLVLFTEKPGQGRYRLLETLRQYARERLQESGEGDVVYARHRDFFLVLAEEVEPQLHGPNAKNGLDVLETNHDNFRVALDSSQSAGIDLEIGLRLAGALWRFWWMRGHLREGRQWLERTLSRRPASPSSARARVLHGLGVLANAQGDMETARSFFQESLALWRKRGDKRGLAESLRHFGFTLFCLGHPEQAKVVLEESLALRQELGDTYGIADSLRGLAEVVDSGRARSICLESLRLMRQVGDPSGTANALLTIACIHSGEGDYATAMSCYQESLSIAHDLDEPGLIRCVLYGMAYVAVKQGEFETARSCYIDYLSICRRLGDQAEIAWYSNIIAYYQGNRGTGHALLLESLPELRQGGHQPFEHEDKRSVAIALALLAEIACAEGNYAEALQLYRESLIVKRENQDELEMVRGLEDFAYLALVQQQTERAARLFGAAEVFLQGLGLLSGRSVAEDAALAAAWAEGGTMTLEQAVRYALEEN